MVKVLDRIDEGNRRYHNKRENRIMETTEITMIPLDRAVESRTNPRRHFDPVFLKELAQRITEKGVLQPLTARPIASKQFEIVIGACRYRAAKIAGLTELPAVVRNLSDQDTLEIQVIENLHRSDIHPLDEALGYEQLMKKNGYDVETIAAKVGKDPSYIYKRMKLTDLIEPAKKEFLEHVLPLSHAIELCRLQA